MRNRSVEIQGQKSTMASTATSRRGQSWRAAGWLAWALLCVQVPCGGAEQRAVKVLLLSGRNNHAWQETTPKLVQILQDCGRFEVEVTESPSTWTRESLHPYDVVLSNWNNFPGADRTWGPQAEASLLEFVRNGKGFALFHAASACFGSWPEFQQLIGATWGPDTGHSAVHAFAVTRSDLEHPITLGLTSFQTTDELWHRMQVQPSSQILARAYSSPQQGGSGQMEPVTFCTRFGEGRCFHLVLGHDVTAMSRVGWMLLILRGTQWAATGAATIQVPLDIHKELQSAAQYHRGQDRAALERLDDLVRFCPAYPQLAEQLAGAFSAMLSQQASDDLKRYSLEQLSLIGSAANVAAIEGLLGDPNLGEPTRFALERIPGEESAAALRRALATTQGRMRIGIIASLGQRHDRKAVEGIRPFLTNPDPELAGAAIEALGTIGGEAAVRALQASGASVSPLLQARLADAEIRSSGSLPIQERDALYQTLASGHGPDPVRRAAFIGRIETLDPQGRAGDAILAAIKAEDPVLQAAAIYSVHVLRDSQTRRQLADALTSLPVTLQPALAAGLADTGDRQVLPGISRLLSSDSQEARIAAMGAIARLDDGSQVGPLILHLTGPSREEQEAAQDCLIRLAGDKVDGELTQALTASGNPQVRKALIHILVSRRASCAVGVLLTLMRTGDPELREPAIHAIGSLAGLEAFGPLTAILNAAGPERERSAAESALVATCGRVKDVNEVLDRVDQGIATSNSTAKASLLRVVGRFGGPRGLVTVRTALNDPGLREAAIRVLCVWPDSAAMADLLAVARTSDNPSHKILALRGLADLYRKADRQSASQWVTLASQALSLAQRPDERKALLSALPQTPTVEALDLAASQLTDPSVSSEAAMAVVRIAEAMKVQPSQPVRRALNLVAASSPSVEVSARIRALMIQIDKPINLALGATASSPDGWDRDGQAGGDQAAIDGDPSTYWDEEDGKDLYRYRVTLKQPTRVSSLRLTGYSHRQYAPKDFDILCDDRVVRSVREAAYTDNVLVVAFPATTCTSLELKISGRHGPSPAIRELELYYDTSLP